MITTSLESRQERWPKILKGEEKASDTPFITASKAELYVNTAAADKIGMTLDADYIKDAAETFDKIEVK